MFLALLLTDDCNFAANDWASIRRTLADASTAIETGSLQWKPDSCIILANKWARQPPDAPSTHLSVNSPAGRPYTFHLRASHILTGAQLSMGRLRDELFRPLV